MSSHQTGIVVLIPALNEMEALPEVLGDLPWEWADGVIVIDNGSSDETSKVARAGGAHVVWEASPGYGTAMQRGLDEMARLFPDSRVIVFLDADYSDHPERLPELVRPILRDEADFVLGSRTLGTAEAGALPPQSYWGNRLACVLIRLFWGVEYTDLGPFRAIRRSGLVRLGMIDRNFGWTVEMQIKAAVANLRILEVPVPYRVRVGKSKISGTLGGSLRAGWKILYTIARYGLRQEGRLDRMS